MSFYGDGGVVYNIGKSFPNAATDSSCPSRHRHQSRQPSASAILKGQNPLPAAIPRYFPSFSEVEPCRFLGQLILVERFRLETSRNVGTETAPCRLTGIDCETTSACIKKLLNRELLNTHLCKERSIRLLTNSRRSQSEKQWASRGQETAARKPRSCPPPNSEMNREMNQRNEPTCGKFTRRVEGGWRGLDDAVGKPCTKSCS